MSKLSFLLLFVLKVQRKQFKALYYFERHHIVENRNFRFEICFALALNLLYLYPMKFLKPMR